MHQLLRKSFIFFMAFVIAIPVLFISVSEAEAKSTYVKSYYKKDGTYVKGHYRNTKSGSSSYSSSPSPSPSYTESKKELYKTRNIVNLYSGKNLITSREASSFVFVQGYYREDGVYVRPHFRTHANNFLTDNLSYNGLSSLLPITSKYSLFTYSSETAKASVERYLHSVVLSYSLKQNQLDNLKLYASKLALKEASAIKFGESFYKDLGFQSELAQSQTKFDTDGILNLDNYLHLVLVQQGKSKLTDAQRNMLETYDDYLNASEDYSKRSLSRSTGLSFYQSLGMSYSLAKEQVEMDLLQDETALSLKSGNNSSETNIQQNIFFDLSAFPHELETFNNYLRTVLKTYSLKEGFTNSDLTSYAITLYVSADYIKYTFAKDEIYRAGLSFYKKVGLTEEAAKKQAEIDFNFIEAAYSKN